MRYLCLDDLRSGCHYYRTKLQYEHLAGTRVISGTNETVNPKDFDAVVFNRIGIGDPEEAMMNARKHGLKIIYDCDDALDLIPRFSPSYQIKKNIHFYYTMLREADLVTTTTEELKKHLSKFTDKLIELKPNIPQEFPKLNLPSNKIPRIGFSGSVTHIKDILIVLKSVIEIQKEKDIEFYLFGFSDEYDSVESWAKNVRGKYTQEFNVMLEEFIGLWRKINSPIWAMAVSYSAYPLMLSYLNFDIGLCPLEDTEFNRCKSSIKYLEYNKAGIKCVASDIPPYIYCKDNIILTDNFTESILRELNAKKSL